MYYDSVEDHLGQITPDERAGFERRIGTFRFNMRIQAQASLEAHTGGMGRTLAHLDRIKWMHRTLTFLLKATLLYGYGHRNYHAIEVNQRSLPIRDLPPAFEGFRILQLSDLHLDLDDSLAGIVAEVVTGLECDLCVLTGDFRDEPFGDFDQTAREVARIRERIAAPAYAIAGNHDPLQVIAAIERTGLPFLLNEHVRIERNGDVIYLVGVDDPHYYENDCLPDACRDLPDDAIALLLTHSPVTYKQAWAGGMRAMLCGHTHGGQLCLPGGKPILVNSNCRRSIASGPWSFQGMPGYTSRGTGAGGVPVRFFCPPEVVVHTLVRAPSRFSSASTKD